MVNDHIVSHHAQSCCKRADIRSGVFVANLATALLQVSVRHSQMSSPNPMPSTDIWPVVCTHHHQPIGKGGCKALNKAMKQQLMGLVVVVVVAVVVDVGFGIGESFLFRSCISTFASTRPAYPAPIMAIVVDHQVHHVRHVVTTAL